MYTLKSEQYSTVENWVNSLPDSLVKGNYIKWLSELKSKERLTTDELEKFVALSNALPVEFQSFPQNFSLSVKNITADASDIVSEPKKTSKKEAATDEKPQSEKVREGAKLNPEKEETKPVKPTVVVVNKK